MLKCEECGLIFDESEVAVWRENRGEFWGQPCYETMRGCPKCYSDAIEEYKENEENDSRTD